MSSAHATSAGLAIALLALGLAGCQGPEAIERPDVVHAYRASTFTTTTADTTTDQLARGAELELELHADGTTSGRLFVPGGAEDGGDLDADLTGTWSFDDEADRVQFEHEADTFIRDMTFTAVRARGAVRLTGEDTFGGTTVEVVLSHAVFVAGRRTTLPYGPPARS